jgi:ribonuclease E
MTKRMLIDATHAEETRVVVLDGSRLEDFDVETSTKKQLKGNIYLAKVVRVEPSLQAAFVEYGGNRHGFLAFGEIHPDYYQIPVADRQRLLAMEAEDARREEEEEDRAALRSHSMATSDAMPSDVMPPDETVMADHSADDAEPPFETEIHGGPETPREPETSHEPEIPRGREIPSEPESMDAAGPHDVDTVDSAAAPSAPVTPSQGAPVPGASAPVAPARAQAARIEIDSVGGTFDTQDGLPDPLVLGVPAATALQEVAERTAEPEIIATMGESPAADWSAADMPEAATWGAVDAAADPGNGDRDAYSEDADAGDVATRDANAREANAREASAREADPGDAEHDAESDGEDAPESPPPETVGGDPDAAEDARERRIPPRFMRNYKIQEVIRRRQILLVQVVKEERGTKGAALTTYVSLAGRFCVLMPNSPRGGGISRKITSATDRRRLKEVTAELEIPDGMGLIVRTAGANRPKPEIKRDCEYLMRLWDDIREHTMKSVAPALIYEEASLIKRAIRDVYSRDIDEILVDGEEGWKSARDFMRMLMPSHVKKVQFWRESQPLFARQQVEAQLDAMLLPTVQLRSGGYLVINQTEALVAIDVNSGRSTRERGIEETALRTNLEAVDEVARQLRLRDLAGLIVIDLIDMESRRNNAAVERRLKEALKVDRARIQLGHISHFGLMEMSRQRLRPSLAETSFVACPHCGGTGHVRGTESAAIHVLRDIEEEGAKRRAAEIQVRVALPIAMYVLNHKRARLAEIEARYAMHVNFEGDDSLIPPQVRIERVRAQVAIEASVAVTQDARPELEPQAPSAALHEDDVADEDDSAEAEAEAEGVSEDIAPGARHDADQGASQGANGEGETAEEREHRRRRRRRRRGGRREEGAPVIGDTPQAGPGADDAPHAGPDVGPPAEFGSDGDTLVPADLEEHVEGVPEHADPGSDGGAGDDAARGRRRGRRGGRRRRRDGSDGGLEPTAEPGAEQPDLPPIYTGPTPANPFGGQDFDIFDVLERAERQTERPMAAISERAPEPASDRISVPPPEWLPQPMPEAEADVVVEPAADVETGAEPALDLEPTPDPEPALDLESAPDPESAPIPMMEAVVAAVAPAADLAVEPTTELPTPPVPANDATPEPLARPIVIGGDGDAPAAEKKRGWWRR